MRGVDKGNQNSAYYHNNHKSLKWWKTIFNSLIKVSINNAYILYKTRNPFTARTPLKFRERLVEQLIELYLREAHHQRIASLPRGRIIAGMHQIGQRKQKNCFICSTRSNRKTSEYYCIECDKQICVHPCFYILHTKLNLNSRKKESNLE